MRARWTRPALLAAALLAAAAGAACSDFLAPPAGAEARLSLALLPGAPAGQVDPGVTFGAVDALFVRVSRGDEVVMQDSFAVAPSGGEIRSTIVVPLDGDEEDLDLAVELHADRHPVYVGGRSVRLVRGGRTVAEVELLPVAGGGHGVLVVAVANALNGQPVPGATVVLRPGASALPGDSVAHTGVTATGGQATFHGVHEGPYTLFVTAQGMIPATVPGVRVVADSVRQRAVVLSPVVPAGQTRIVLTWGADPDDLDAHLLGPDGAGGTFHVYFGSPVHPDSGTADVELDVDEVFGFGPETITIRRQLAGTYCFSVQNFSGEAPLGTSGAQVRVFRGAEQVAAFTAPNTTADVWSVFRMSGGVVTAVNGTSGSVPQTCP